MHPIILFGIRIEMEELLQLLISAFRLTICSWVKCCRSVLFDTERSTHFDRKTAHEAGVSIVDKDFGESHMLEHVF